MSRTTTDDCTDRCPNHFNLAYHAAQRAHEIMRRGDARVPEREDKSVVVALREIAAGASDAPPLAADAEQSESPDDSAEAANAGDAINASDSAAGGGE